MLKTLFSILSVLTAALAAPPFAYTTHTPGSTFSFSSGAPVAYAAGVPALGYGYSAAAVAPGFSYAAAPAVFQAPAVVKAIAPEPYDPNPQYSFGYSVQDLSTGDQKSHSETRNGDVVTGEYSLVEPDGALRTVKYSSSPLTGFNADVQRTAPHGIVAAQPAIVAAQPAPVFQQAYPYGAAYGAFAGYPATYSSFF